MSSVQIPQNSSLETQPGFVFCCLEENSFYFWETVFVLKALDWLDEAHPIIENCLFYLKSTD